MEFLSPLSGRISKLMNDLTREFNREEIFSKLNQMHLTKAPDPDGNAITIFFRSFGIL